jgi:hypothetical protein
VGDSFPGQGLGLFLESCGENKMINQNFSLPFFELLFGITNSYVENIF